MVKTIQSLRARLSGVFGAALVATLSALMAAPAGAATMAQDAQTVAPQTQTEPVPESVKLSPDQLDSLVAPIALYPDPLLAQCLVASTYPIDIVAAQQWLAKNSTLKGDALVQAAEQQEWDPSVQALVSLPDALKLLSENIAWTQDLGDAFLAQQSDVMDAVQRMRGKAKDAGKLESTEQQKVETKVVEEKTVIEIQPASTEVVYVPTYSPTVIWGPPVYPYYPMYYPPYYGRRLARLRRRNRRRNRDFRRLGMGLRLGRQQQHHHQQQQQLRQPPQLGRTNAGNRTGNEQLAAQRPAARRRPLQGPGDREQVRRRHARRLGVGPAGPGAASARAWTAAARATGRARAASTAAARAASTGAAAAPARSAAATCRPRARAARPRSAEASYSGSSARSSSSRGSSSMGGMRGGGGGGRRR